ncbi:Uncharacterised protein [Serratia fonticola]|uniref:hypothetical protein n=1 Tax=Serratia fonticola TaxID=47917 RepID=UPI002182EE12|nr:hypothetical protein [Serratia fonticola]CAI2479584.1 Uncharacterised protein [Serratia fonticola]
MATSEDTTSSDARVDHDQRLSELLDWVTRHIETAQSENELIEIIERVKAFDGVLRFKHIHKKTLAVASFLIAIIIGSYHYATYHFLSSPIWMIVGAFGLCSLGLVIYMWRKSSNIRSLAERLYQYDILLDNHLRELKSELPSLKKELFTDYVEFDRGNYSRDIPDAYEGYYQGKTHAFHYHFYHFHFVDERTVTRKDSKGNTKTRKVYDHYDRYGITLAFRFVSQLAVTSKAPRSLKGERYKPASIQFNRTFKVVANTEMTAARFLKPAIILACEEAAGTFKSLNLEFNQQAGLCMSFENSNILVSRQQYDFMSPDKFIAEIEKTNILPELNKALVFIHTLMVHSDNNFKKDGE